MNAWTTDSGHPVTHVAFAPDGSALAVAQPHTGVTLFDRATGRAVRVVGDPRAAGYTAVTFCNGGAWLATATPKGLEVYATDGTRVCRSFHWFMKSLLLAARGPDLLTADARMAFLVTAPPPGQTEPTRTHLWGVDRDVVLTGLAPDGRWALGLRPNTRPVLIDGASGSAVAAVDHALRPPPWPEFRQLREPSRVVFAAAADRFAASDGESVSVFDRHEPDDDREESVPAPVESEPRADLAPPPRGILEPIFRLDPPEKWPADRPWVPPVALTPDGRGLLVRRPRNRVQLWDVDAGRLRNDWGWRLESVTCLAVAPDGLTAAAGGRFGRVVMWDLE
jgi:hypothetical protein